MVRRRRNGQGHREDRLRLRRGRVSVPVAAKHLEPASRRRLLIPALGLNQILSWGSSYYLLAVLAGPIAADTGWPLPWIVGSLSAGLLVAGLVSPRVGRLIGRHGGRPVLATSVALIATGLALLALAPNLAVFVSAWLIVGLGMGAGLYDAAFSTLGRIYGSRARGAITTLTLWGGFASTVCWPISAYLVQTVGWRGTCLTFAAIHLGLSLPMILVAIPREVATVAPDAAGSSAGVLIPAERRSFLLLMSIMTLGGIIASVVSVHLLTLLQEQGSSLAVAVSLGALIGPAQVGGRVVEMAFKERHHPIWTLLAAVTFMALGIVLLWAGFPSVALALVLYGVGNGVYSIARGTLPLALFGPERYPPLVGRIARPTLIAGAIAPSLAAVVLSRTGADATLAVMAAIALLNVLLGLVLWARCWS
jgi:predicted MFS family arabinose efflux permease